MRTSQSPYWRYRLIKEGPHVITSLAHSSYHRHPSWQG
jgi:hypothetical protein